MFHFIEQPSYDAAIDSHREFASLTILGKLAGKGYFNQFHKSHVPPVNSILENFGMVYTKVTFDIKGVVRFKNSWWFALSSDDLTTIYPGQQVRVTEIFGSTLLVEPC